MKNSNKIIHQIWYQGNHNIPANLQDYQLRNKNFCEKYGWKYMFWDEKTIDLLVAEHFATHKNFFGSLRFLHQKIDVAKIMILYKHGGLYLDMDSYVYKEQKLLKVLEDMVTNGPYTVVLSALHLNNDLFLKMIFCKGNILMTLVNNGVIFTEANSHFMLHYLLKIEEQTIISQHWGENKSNCINRTTGPYRLSKIYFRAPHHLQKEVKILDSSYFESYFMGVNYITDKTCILHQHNITWISPFLVKVITILLKYKNGILSTVGLGVLLFYFWLYF